MYCWIRRIDILGFDSKSVLPVSSNAVNYSIQQVVPYGVPLIGAPDIWPVTRGSSNVHVAVIDTGIDVEHPDLVHAYMGGYNVLDHEVGLHRKIAFPFVTLVMTLIAGSPSRSCR